MALEITGHNDLTDAEGNPNPLYGTSTVKRVMDRQAKLPDGSDNPDYDPNPPSNSITLAAFNALLAAANGNVTQAIANWPQG